MGNVWSLGIFKENLSFNILQGQKTNNLIYLLSGRKIRNKYYHIHTYADPFLCKYKDKLYLFAEIQAINEPGHINCWECDAAENWKDLGPVMKPGTHVSYPFVFKDRDDRIYLIPESAYTKEIALWEFDNFPFGLRKRECLLNGAYYDSSIIYHNECYYLFTTNEQRQMFIFYSDSLHSGNWASHPANPVTSDKRISRNGGGVIKFRDKLLRIAQSGIVRYGEGIVVLEVSRLDKEKYEETILIEDYLPNQDFFWQTRGRHHLSICDYNGSTFVAMDGLTGNFKINTIINGIYKILKR